MAKKIARRLRIPQYSEEERRRIIDYLMALRTSYIRDLLEQYELPKSGTKAELRERIESALEDGDLTYPDIVRWIDQIEPWGKQHVYLFKGPEGRLIRNWRNQNWVTQHLQRHQVGHFLNAHVPLILPRELSLSSICYNNNAVRIVTIERRDYWERDKEQDETRQAQNGQDVELRAYVHYVKRGMITFEWDLTSNNAILQISQLPGTMKYEAIHERFSELLRPWLDISRFSLVDLSLVIKRLHENEELGVAETRSHVIDYSSMGGRRVSGKSPSSRDSLLGEQVIDTAMSNIRRQGVGHLGNFYWLPRNVNPSHSNPLESEVHIFLIAAEGRVAFTTPNTEGDVRYVLSRVRALGR